MLRPLNTPKFDITHTELRRAFSEAQAALSDKIVSVIPHPNDDMRILRKVEAGNGEPVEYLDIAHLHWNQLPDVTIPEALFATSIKLPWQERKIYASVQKLEGQKALDLLLSFENTPEKNIAVAGLIKSMDSYFGWVLNTKQPYVLGDLGVRQFLYGRPAQTADAPKMYLPDLDPYLQPMESSPLQPESPWNKRIAEFAAFAEIAGIVPNTPFVQPAPKESNNNDL